MRRPAYKAVPATATLVPLAANGALSVNEACQAITGIGELVFRKTAKARIG